MFNFKLFETKNLPIFPQELRKKWFAKKVVTPILIRDVTAGATGATTVLPKFLDTLTLSQPGGGRFYPTSQR